MNNYNVIKLTNNVTIVGDCQFTPEDLMVLHPLEVYSKPIQDGNGKVIGEQMILRPFLVMTGDNNVVIDTYNVLHYNKLDNKLIGTYEEMVKNVYAGSVEYDGNAYVANELKDYSEEEREYMKEVLDEIIHGEKVIH